MSSLLLWMIFIALMAIAFLLLEIFGRLKVISDEVRLR